MPQPWPSPATDRPDLFPDAETQAVVESFGREVVERTARAETHLKGGMEAQSSGKAEAELKQAVAMDPLNAEGHSALATVLKGKGANDEAIVHLRKAVALEPSRRADERRLVAQLGVRAEQLPSPRMDLVDLYENFVENPAAAFPKAARMFDKPRRGGDLDGMMQILRVVAREGIRWIREGKRRQTSLKAEEWRARQPDGTAEFTGAQAKEVLRARWGSSRRSPSSV
ncbi:MAG: hypothetical protein HYU43_09710 [Armatimonadetes bacterium]|nr:hypothetical protein [Armatimonadota bacterium]